MRPTAQNIRATQALRRKRALGIVSRVLRELTAELASSTPAAAAVTIKTGCKRRVPTLLHEPNPIPGCKIDGVVMREVAESLGRAGVRVLHWSSRGDRLSVAA